MDHERLIETACEQTGLTDFGSDSFRDGLVRYVDAVNDTAALSEVGNFALEAQVTGNLVIRPEVISAILFRGMVPLLPASSPSLAHASVLISSGKNDPIVPEENARRLAAMLERAGAMVTLRFEPAGHALATGNVAAAKEWLKNLK